MSTEEKGREGPHLVLQKPEGDDLTIALGRDAITLGRRTSNDVQLLDPTVSREHARVGYADDAFFIEDFESTHGTFVNDQRVSRQTLRHNDRIRLGKAGGTTLIFRTHREFSDLVETAEALEPTAENLRNLTALLEISKAVNSSLRLDDVLDKVMEAVLALTRAERGMLLLGEDAANLTVRVQRNFDTSQSEELRYSSTVVADVFTTGRPLILTDAMQDSRFSGQESIVGLNLRTVMCVPLRTTHRMGTHSPLEEAAGLPFAGEADSSDALDATMFISAGDLRQIQESDARVMGAIYVDRRSPTRFFTDQDLALLESFTSHAAVAIDNAALYEEALEKRRLERDIEVAKEIQQSLLQHQFPEIEFARIHALNHPSRHVGGDYYEVFTTESGDLGFAVGDVSGKGVPAALLMATLQSSFLAESSAQDDLARVCARVNRFLVQRTTPERYATFFTGRVGADRKLLYVNAGHNPQLLFRSGEVSRLSGGGLPLGLFDGRDYEVQEIELQPEDLLVCFTDGVTEATNPADEEFGEQRLIETVMAQGEVDVRALTEAVFTAIEHHSVGQLSPADDITLLAVRML